MKQNNFIKTSMEVPAEVLDNLPKKLERKRNASSVSLTIETISRDEGCSLLEACEIFLNEDGMGDQEFAALLTPSLRDKLEIEARAQNYIRDELPNKSLEEWF